MLTEKLKKLEKLIKHLEKKEKAIKRLKKEIKVSNRRMRSKTAMRRIKKLLK